MSKLPSYLDPRERELVQAAGDLAAGVDTFDPSLYGGLEPADLVAICAQLAGRLGDPIVSRPLERLSRESGDALSGPIALDRILLRDHQTTVVALGRGNVPLIIIHSLGLDWRMAKDILAPLAADRRVIAYDLRLHGTAVDVEPESFTLDTCADDLAQLLDALSIERAEVVGFSLGGAVAQHFALRHPTRIARLGLVCTMAVADRDKYAGRATAARSEGMAQQLVPTMLRWFNPPALAIGHWGTRYAREMVLSVPPDRWARYWDALSEVDTLDRLHEIRVPTAVIAGELDASTPPSSMRPIAEAIPDASFQIVDEAPHMITLAMPSRIAALLAPEAAPTA